MYWYS